MDSHREDTDGCSFLAKSEPNTSQDELAPVYADHKEQVESEEEERKGEISVDSKHVESCNEKANSSKPLELAKAGHAVPKPGRCQYKKMAIRQSPFA